MVGTLYYDIDRILLDFTGPFANYWNAGLKQKNRWTGNPVSDNPITWSFGYCPGINDMTELNRAIDLFHEQLPIMDSRIPNILNDLKNKYKIILVSSYPNTDKRIS